jgi:undecaprenyl-phosphate 4-deoxy-4-formamido-L-arabinose transferase
MVGQSMNECNDDQLYIHSISIVIPVFNSQEILRDLIVVLERELPKLSSQYEVILVNDGSLDKSWDIICQLTHEYCWIQSVDLMRNYGQHNALLCGIRVARNDVIIIMDDDMQNSSDEIHKLLAKLSEGYDVIYGTPNKEQHGLWRNLASEVTKLALQSTMEAETARADSGVWT